MTMTSTEIWDALVRRLGNNEPLVERLTKETRAAHPQVDEAHDQAVDEIRMYISRRYRWPLDEPWPAALERYEVSLTLHYAVTGTGAPEYVTNDAKEAVERLKDISTGKADIGDVDPATAAGEVIGDVFYSEPGTLMDSTDPGSPLMVLKGGGLPPK